MKKIYFLLILIVITYGSSLAQLTIVDAVAVDGDGDGYYATVEIEFSAPVNDSEFELSAITQDEWDFSEHSDFSSIILASNFYTDVNVISNENVANDRYVRVTMSSQFSSSNGPIYIRYTNDNPAVDSVSAYYTPADILADFATYSATDNSPPVVSSRTYDPSSGTVGVGEKIELSFTFEGAETGITADTIIFNGTYVPTDSLIDDGGGSYHFNYWVAEGNNDIGGSDTIPFSIIFSDTYGNKTDPYTDSPASNSCPGVDANTPVITSVVYEPGDGTTVGDNFDIYVYLTVKDDESGLSDDYVRVNNQPANDFATYGSGYRIRYRTNDGTDTELDDGTKMPLKVVLSDGTNLSDTLTEADILVDNSPGISFSSPEIDSVNFIPESGVVGIGDTITVILYAKDAETGLEGSSLTINGQTIYNESLVDNGDGSYTFKYIVLEGHNDRADSQKIIFDFILTDGVNTTPTFDEGDITVDDCPGIDANRPTITTVSFSAGDSDTLAIGDDLDIDIDVGSSESGLSVSEFIVNGIDVSGTFFEGGSRDYRATYTVADGEGDVDNANRLPFSFILNDGVNYSSEYTEADLASDITPGVDANDPAIKSVTFSPGHGTTLGIDSVLTVTIEAENSETGLTASARSVNGVDGTFNEVGSGVYTVSYTVQSGHGSVDDDAAAVAVSLAFDDGINTTITPFTGSTVLTTPGIDDSAPSISGVTLQPNSGTVIVGDTITFTIEAGEEGLKANTISINSKDLINEFVEVGSGQYEVEYVIKSGDDEISDASSIPISIILNDEAGNESNDFNSLAAGNCPGIDSEIPVINSVTSDATTVDTLIVNDEIKFTVDIATTEANLIISPSQYNGQNLNWTEVSGGDTYEGTYTVTEGEQDIESPLQLTGVTATDVAGNVSNEVDGSDVAVYTDANTPVILSVTSDATATGTLAVGDQINFTVDVETADGSLTVNPPDYNGGLLNWYTDDGGSTYKGTYTVTNGGADQSSAIQLTGVTLSDPAGNVSASEDGSDVQKTIDSNLPVISSVELKDKSKIIGDEDTLHITINADADYSSYTLVSGTVAGYSISSIEPVNSTTIYAFFDITERTYDIDSSETVTVSDLQLSDGTNLSNEINTTVTNDNHAIFSKRPTAQISGNETLCNKDSTEVPIVLSGHAPYTVTYTDGFTPVILNSITSSPYMLKIIADESIGDPLTYTITNVTDATGNTNSGTGSFELDINSLPDAYFTSPTNGDNFDISYDTVDLVATPVGGVFSGTGVFSATDQFSPSLAGLGFHDLYYNYEDINGCKDADTVNIEVIEGGTITFAEGTSTYCSYRDTFRVIGFNNFGDDGTFSLVDDPGGALINIAYDTAMVKPELLAPGNWTLKYAYPSGDTIVSTFFIEEVGASITFSSVGNHCEDYSDIEIEAKNLSPLGGTGYFTLSDGGVSLNPYNSGNNIRLDAGDLSPGTYTLEYYYETVNGCYSDPGHVIDGDPATLSETFEIYALPTVSFAIGTDTIYNVDQGSSMITGLPTDAGGVFSSTLDFIDDNNDGTANIDPETIDLGTQWIYYTYTDGNGCINSDTLEIEVREALGSIASASGSFQYCYYGSAADIITGTPDPTDGSAGSFYINDVLVTPLEDNKITVDPQVYGDGNHTIRFDYSDGSTTYSVYKNFNVDSIGDIYFTGLDDKYCEDDNIEIELTAFYTGDDGTREFTGNGISDVVEDELAYFYPNLANLGDNVITYTFTRDYSGCTKTYDQTTVINSSPTVAFYPNEKCIVSSFDPLGFTTDTVMSDSIVSWDWTYKSVYKSFDKSPVFDQTVPGYNSMRLKLTTVNGCENTVDSTFYIGTRVDIQFAFENECHGETVLFDLLTSSDTDDTLSTNWNFGGDGVADLSDRENPTFIYDDPGAYEVIYEEVLKSCGRIADTAKITIRPSVDLSEGIYLEEFEDIPDNTGWVIENYEDGANNTWQWGEPAGIKINSASSGTNAFVTNLTGEYDDDEKGMITSPCFDFSSMERPMMKMDYVSYTETDRDGAVLQYSRDGDWVTIGVPSDGINWYNSYIISGSPAGQQLGWTGELVSSDNNGWNTAMFRLDELRGRAGVRFRLVFGSNGDFTDEGFAFDNIQFKERERIVLLENFTNSTDDEANNIQDNTIAPIVEKDSLDVICLNYHTSFPSANAFNTYYPSGPSARALYYGVSQIPYSIVDGQGAFDYSIGNELSESDIHKRVLVDPNFSISLKQDIQGDDLVVSAYIKALGDITGKDIVAYIAVVEKTVISDSEPYYNVLRIMLPDAAGTLIEKDWLANDSINIYQKSALPDGSASDSLVTIVFIQDEETKEIYQVAYATEFSTITSVEELESTLASYDYRAYPNPVKDALTLELIKTVSYDIKVDIYNNIGALVKSDKLLKGENLIEFDTSDLPGGIYYLRLRNSEKIIDSKKIIKID